MIPPPTIGATLAFVALCVTSDVSTRRIPNLLCGIGMLAGLVLNTIYFGSGGLVASGGLLGRGGGLIVTGGVLLFPFGMGGIGGGDVKMMGAIGALLGAHSGFVALLVGLTFGGALMAVHLARRRRLGQTLLTVGTM